MVVATDDDRIRAAAPGFSGDVTLTCTPHRSGTDRVAEAAGRTAYEVIVNIQGDEFFVNPTVLEQVVDPRTGVEEPDMAKPCKRIDNRGTFEDPNVVKVVTDDAGMALYSSRSPIPCPHSEAVARV